MAPRFITTLACIALASLPAFAQADVKTALVKHLKTSRDFTLKVAEQMPDADYGFKPTAETRPFGQLVAHVALSQFGTCAALKGDAAPPHKDDKEETTRGKSELVTLLKDSAAYCDPALTAMKDEEMPVLTKAGANQVAKGLFLLGTVTHGNEMYGTMAVYLRLKGLVPPSTERQNAQKKSQ